MTFVLLKSRSIKPFTKHVYAHVGEQRETPREAERETERRKEQIENV